MFLRVFLSLGQLLLAFFLALSGIGVRVDETLVDVAPDVEAGFALPGAHYQHALSEHIENLGVARIRKLFLPSPAESFPEEDVLLFTGKNFV
ncbi:MAG: hypothetical protein LAO03_02640 [Acidobacteriia bacterium]|nr:hypothetical protein [Terriglobia bacterium]